MKTFRKQIAVLLAVMMLLCSLTAVSFSASAAEAESTISVTSNLCDPLSLSYGADDAQVEVTYYLQSDNLIVDMQGALNYDDTVLEVADTTVTSVMPSFASGAMANFTVDNQVLFNASSLNLYNFKTEGVFFTVTFDIIGSGDTTVDLDVEVLTGTTAASFAELSAGKGEDVDMVYYDSILADELSFRAEGEVIGATDAAVSIFGDINLDLADNDGDGTYEGYVDLQAGTYTYKINEEGVELGNGSSFTDELYKITYDATFKKATTLVVSGGRYTFSFATSTNKLTVNYKPFDEIVELFGDINVTLYKSSGTLFTGSARLDAGSYDFRVNEMGVQHCFGYTFDDAVYKITYNPDWTSATTFVASGGLYTFKYDVEANQLTVLHAAAGLGDVRIFGDINLNLAKDYGTLYSATTTLQAGTYTFRVDELGTTMCNGSTFTESIYKITYSSEYKKATTFNVENGKYTFRYDTATNQLTVLYAPPAQTVSIFGDIDLELTKGTGTTYTATTTLAAGTYAFRIDEFGTTLCFGGTFTDEIGNKVYSTDFVSATTFKATGGTYKFSFNTETNKLIVKKTA